ncbi:MAG: regulatory iron-sulfur-containing complex subunit RicT [Mariniphaga sp.]
MNTLDKTARGCPTNDTVGSCAKLNVYDWLYDVKSTINTEDVVEIRFKNTRKDYFRNVNGLTLKAGDMVAVEASPGHDIGMVSLIGDLVLKQMKRHKVTMIDGELRKIYRIAKPVDLQKWEEAIASEHETMLKARKIAEDLKLNMKIGDVEFQGDKTKAIFYYIADERVDFRQLIRLYADTFRIRIEMRQIGARQEAARIGGIGPCGRELCCSSWISNFVSVTTNAARYQEISLNPQKLAGQCGKLKCCLNYELDCYIDALKNFPSTNIQIETETGNYNYLKADIFKGIFWYVKENNQPGGMVSVSVEKVREIHQLNRSGKKIAQLTSDNIVVVEAEGHTYHNSVGLESIDRFDPASKNRRKKRHKPVLTRKPNPANESDQNQQSTEE